ncbi:profilin-1-like [Hemiscyllium ocellatum]|uniref:profilin-1-like n=1 Tax=Hemiscyllium ocellatum TaxID=170820 RepID=UPI0029669734|nr:profilin-1-like [Hemiscyllium ocellatum]
MTWMDYVDSLMAKSGVADVAIVGLVCKSVWAATVNGNFSKITSQQVGALLGDLSTLQQCGIQLGDKKYTFVVAEYEQSCGNDWKWLTISAKGDTKVSAVVHKTVTALLFIEAANIELKGPQLLECLQCTVNHLVENKV